jgi:hypothetical protein
MSDTRFKAKRKACLDSYKKAKAPHEKVRDEAFADIDRWEREDRAWELIEGTVEWKQFCIARHEWGLAIKAVANSKLGIACETACKKQSSLLRVVEATEEAKYFMRETDTAQIMGKAMDRFVVWMHEHPEYASKNTEETKDESEQYPVGSFQDCDDPDFYALVFGVLNNLDALLHHGETLGDDFKCGVTEARKHILQISERYCLDMPSARRSEA